MLSTRAVTVVLAAIALVSCSGTGSEGDDLAVADSSNTTEGIDEDTSDTETPNPDVEVATTSLSEQAEESGPSETSPSLVAAQPEKISGVGVSPNVGAFVAELGRFSHGDPDYPSSIDQLVEWFDIIAVGEIIGFEEGRKEFLSYDPETESPIYARYINVLVKPTELVSGQLREANEPMAVEFPYPNNADERLLAESTPLGLRVLIFATHTDMDYARDAAEELVEVGILPPDSLAANLLGPAPYGFIVDGNDGAKSVDHSPIFELAAQAFGVPIDGFDDAVALLRTASDK